MTLRCVYVGNFLHPWTTETHVARDAERIPGVEVVRVQEPQHANPKFLHVIEAAARDADLLIYQRTWGLPSEAIDLWRTLESRGTQTASYHLDLYVGLERQKTIRDDDPFWQTGVVFTADGDPRTQKVLQAKGVDHRWLPAACVSDECYIAKPEKIHPPADVIFVGSHTVYHPEHAWRFQLLEALTVRYGSRFVKYPRDNKRIHGAALNTLYVSTPCVVGDSLALPGTRRYTSDRVFESLGRGAALVYPRLDGLDELGFREGEHLRCYDIGNFDELFTEIDAVLAHRSEARVMAERGCALIRARHTYRMRVETMLASLGLQP